MPTVLEARVYLTRENPERIVRYYEVRGANNHLVLMDKSVRAVSLRIGSRTDIRGYEVPVQEFCLHTEARTLAEGKKHAEYSAALKVDIQQVLAYCILHDLPLWLYQHGEALELHTPAAQDGARAGTAG